jgi:hypothetical protein
LAKTGDSQEMQQIPPEECIIAAGVCVSLCLAQALEAAAKQPEEQANSPS